MDFKQIEAFVSVAKFKSFSRAAESVYLSQPTISSHINTLENELGVILFDRSGKEVQLTPAGILFLDYAVNMLNTRNEAIHSIAEFYNKIEGELHIACSTTPMRLVLPDALKDFSKKYPGVMFKITEMGSDQVLDSIRHFDSEMGIVGKLVPDARLVYSECADDNLVLITPINERFNRIEEDYIELKDLLHERFILREPDSATRQIFETALISKGYNISRLNILSQVSSMDTVLQLVKNGLGVSVISEGAAAEYMNFNLIRRFYIKDLSLYRKIYMVRYNKRTLSPAAKMFESFVLSKH